MNVLKCCASLCLLVTAAFAQELNWAELVRRPDLWPAQCAAKQEMKFDGGVTVRAGQKLNVLKIEANEAQVQTLDGRTTFTVEPDESDLLAVAKADFAKLTPKQRALSYDTVVRQKELWPQRVTLKKTFDMGGGRVAREGDQLVVQEVLADRLTVVSESLKTRFQVTPQSTDIMALSRKLVDDEKSVPRFVDVRNVEPNTPVVAQGGKPEVVPEKKPNFGPVIGEMEGKLLNSVTGKPQPLDEKALPKYIVYYRGSSTCPITRQFTPTLIRYYQQMKPQHPEFEIVWVMTESVEDTSKFAKQLGFSWRAVEYESTGGMPALHRNIQGLLPQLIVMDRSGRVLANGWQNAAPNALKQLDALLKSPQAAAR